MTHEMVLVALGNPERIDKTLEGGTEAETWHIQTGTGSSVGIFTMSVGDKRGAARQDCRRRRGRTGGSGRR
jgi:hypothetical protein